MTNIICIRKPRYCFKVHEDLAKRYIEASIGKKWKEYRGNIWKYKYNPLLSKSEIIKNRPVDIPLDHWALFVEYRSKLKTMVHYFHLDMYIEYFFIYNIFVI